MAIICSRCGKAHPGGIGACEWAEEEHQKFLREVEHHKMHCKECPNPEAHVRRLNSRERRNFLNDLDRTIIGTVK